MSASDVTPICIPSDDDDSDVEIVREEKIDLDDGDVIFVSQTSPTKPAVDKVSDQNSSHSDIQSGTSVKDDQMDIKPPSVISCHRSLSISSGLEMALNLHDHGEVGAPLDLSARKSGDESDDSLDSSCDSTSFSSSDESSLLDIPDQMEIKTESNLPCQKQTIMQNSQLTRSNISTLQAADSSKIKPVSSCPVYQSSCINEYLSDNLAYIQSDIKPAFSSIFKFEPLDRPDCSNQQHASTSLSSLNTFSNTDLHFSSPGPLILSPASPVTHISSPTFLTSPSGPHTSSQGSISSPADTHMQCSAPKKRKDTSPESDIWATIRKDLDFLNNIDDSTLSVSASVPKSLSHYQGANNDDSSINLCTKPKSTDDNLNSETLSNQTNNVDRSHQSVSSNDKLSQHQPLVFQGGQPDSLKSSFSLSTIHQASDTTLSNTSGFTATGSNSNVKQLPPKKLRCFRTNSDPSGNTANNSSVSTETGAKWGSEKCSSCMLSLLGLKSSRCLQGHVTCGACLEERVKLVLTGKSKESLRCVQTDCDSYYPMSELKHSLPSMVVEILEDKLDNDYIDYIANMIMKNAGAGTQDKSDSQSVSSTTSTVTVGQDENLIEMQTVYSSEKQQNPEDWPSNWSTMDKRAGFILVPLKPESPEYIDVAFKFHSSMTFPAADIIKVSRVQNPILWRYHSVKRLEMIHDNEGLNVEERNLFHGTNSSVVDAICKKGFDWRVCGKHGTVYGQGSYFAVNASYSHQYTDKSNSKRPRIVRIGNVSVRSSGRMTYTSQIPRPPQLLIPPPAHAGTNMINNNLPSPPGIKTIQSNVSVFQFGAPINMVPQSQGQMPGATNQSASNNNIPACNNLTSHINSAMIGSPPIQYNPVPPPSSVSHPVNSLSTTPPSKPPGFMFGAFAPRKSNFLRHRLMGASSTSLNFPEEPQESKSVHKIFLSKVLVGKFTGGHAGLRKPPPLFPDTDPYGKCYDSCVDNIMDPKIFVIFDSTQAYPEYMIEYNYTG